MDIPFPTGRRYEVILVDPPWQFKAGHTGREVERHYPTMSLAKIRQLPIADLAEKSCVLLLWTTSPFSAHAYEIIKEWASNTKPSSSGTSRS